jgi:hypothetical protein
MAKRSPNILSITLAKQSQKTLNVVPPLIKQHVSREAWRKQVSRALERGASSPLKAARNAALSLPSKETKSPVSGRRYMRRRIADSLGVSIRTTRDPAVSIVSRRDRMGDAPTLPKRTNEGRWRHKVFGNEGVWVTQYSRQGWFDNTVSSAANVTVRTELVKVLSLLESRWTV